MESSKLKKAVAIAGRPDIVRRSLIVSLVVGSVLNLINQGEALHDISLLNIWKCALTYTVPYLVATYGSVMSLLALDDRQ